MMKIVPWRIIGFVSGQLSDHQCNTIDQGMVISKAAVTMKLPKIQEDSLNIVQAAFPVCTVLHFGLRPSDVPDPV